MSTSLKQQTLERYVETLDELERKKDKARTKDIAEKLDVKEPSVTEMLQKLKRKNFVEYEPYHGATLTKKGSQLAEKLNERHLTLAKFLKTIGVDEKTAEADACKIEHVIAPETMKKLRQFLNFLEESPKKPPKWLKNYTQFLKTVQHPGCDHTNDTEE